METAAECIPTKPREKHTVLWETMIIKKKIDNVRTASICNKRKSINTITQNIKKAQREIIRAYLKEQTEYIRNYINKIRNSKFFDNLELHDRQ